MIVRVAKMFVVISALISGSVTSAAQPVIDVPWGNEVIEVDPSICPIQALVIDRTTYERLGKPTRATVRVVVLVPVENGGYAIAATPPPIVAKEEYDVEIGTVMCFTPVTEGGSS